MNERKVAHRRDAWLAADGARLCQHSMRGDGTHEVLLYHRRAPDSSRRVLRVGISYAAALDAALEAWGP